jgi:hypothetical protein
MALFTLKPALTPGIWECTFQDNVMLCTFQNKHFKKTKEFTVLKNSKPFIYLYYTVYTEAITNWLFEFHRDKCFTEKKRIKINFDFEIPYNIIFNMLVAAMKNGNSIWFWPPFAAMGITHISDEVFEIMAKKCLAGKSVVPVYYLEEIDDNGIPEKGAIPIGFISKDSIENGIKKYMNDGRCIGKHIDFKEEDLDIFLQYIVMGQIVYGY